jgi:hypothetical protein
VRSIRGLRSRRARRDRFTVPHGYIVAPPDFVGVGVQRAGTSWWFALLAAHPQIHHRTGLDKELHFFDRFWEVPFTSEHVTRYHTLFARPPGRIAGEWTPRYIRDFWTLPLLKTAAPDAKILVSLRDPVERFISGLRMMNPAERDPATIADDAFRRGLYHDQLRRLLTYFDRERLLVLQFERCRDEPVAELRRTYDFLGVDDPAFLPAAIGTVIRVPGTRRVDVSEKMRSLLIDLYRDDVHRLASDFPEIDVARWNNFAAG